MAGLRNAYSKHEVEQLRYARRLFLFVPQDLSLVMILRVGAMRDWMDESALRILQTQERSYVRLH